RWWPTSSTISPRRSANVSSIQSATPAWMRTRSRRGSLSYATSRISACLKISSRWPSIVDESRPRTRSRSWSPSSRTSIGALSCEVTSASTAGQNTRPTTAAACSTVFSSAGSRSMRAASAPCTVSGISAAPGALRRARMISSRKNGLPSARARIASRSALPASAAKSRSANCTLSCGESGATADELLDGPALGFDLGPHRLEERPHDLLQRLRVEPLAEGRRAGDVREEHRDDLPFLDHPARRRGELRSTDAAEPSVVGILTATPSADQHLRSVRTQRTLRQRYGAAANVVPSANVVPREE